MGKSNLTMIDSKLVCEKHNAPLIKLSSNSIAVCVKCVEENKFADDKAHQKIHHTKIINSKLKSIQRPIRHESCSFENFNVLIDGQKICYQKSIEFTNDLLAGNVKNMMFVGKTGNGKTHLACSIAERLVLKNMSVRYITSSDLASEIMESWSRKDATEKTIINSFVDYDLLIIDEIGLDDIDANNRKISLVQRVLNARYDRLKSVLIISNLNQTQIKSVIGDRSWSRLHEDGFNVVEFNWSDYRIKKSLEALS